MAQKLTFVTVLNLGNGSVILWKTATSDYVILNVAAMEEGQKTLAKDPVAWLRWDLCSPSIKFCPTDYIINKNISQIILECLNQEAF